MHFLLQRAALGAILCGSLFLLGCPHPPPPPPPPAMHGAIITISQGGDWDHFLIYRGKTCTSLAVLATSNTLSYKDYSGSGSFCYRVRTIFADGSVGESNFGVAVVP